MRVVAKSNVGRLGTRLTAETLVQAFDGKWAVGFIFALFTCQIGLWLWGDTSLRLPLRIGCYVGSLAMLVIVRGNGKLTHPAAKWLPLLFAVLATGLLVPGGNGVVAWTAQTAVYLSVLAPLLWMSNVKVEIKTLQRVATVMWAFYAASAVMGALQVRYPGQFEGALSSNYDDQTIVSHILTLADGTKFLRPKGLTDVPGGAAVGGVYAIILGCGLLLTTRRMVLRGLAVGGMAVGLFCIYIAQGRTNLIIVGLAAAGLLLVLARRGATKHVTVLLSVLTVVAFAGTTVAFAVGGDSTVDRFFTLVAADPGTVFGRNRGQFLDVLVTQDFWTYPFGAGAARWGMASVYFGTGAEGLWAEMMWQALLYDGGILLIVLYICVLAVTLTTCWRIAVTTPSDVLGCWAGVVFGYTIAAVAASFVFPIFAMVMGMEVFVLNACVFGVAYGMRGRAGELLE